MRNILLSEQQFKKLLNEITIDDVDDAVVDVNLTPTQQQKEAGNYKMGHISVKGMRISIENPKKSYRKWFDKETNTSGSTQIKNHYGYFRNTRGNGKDGDAVDVFIGDHIDAFDYVFVVDQKDKNGNFDESKVMLGFLSKDEAKAAYMSNYSANWHGFMAITKVTIPIFKKWLYRGNKQQKPFKDYALIIKNKLREKKSK